MSENPEKNRTTQKAVSRNAFENGMRITSSFHPREWSKSVIGMVRPSRLELSRVTEVIRFASLHLHRVGLDFSNDPVQVVGGQAHAPVVIVLRHSLMPSAGAAGTAA